MNDAQREIDRLRRGIDRLDPPWWWRKDIIVHQDGPPDNSASPQLPGATGLGQPIGRIPEAEQEATADAGPPPTSAFEAVTNLGTLIDLLI